MDIHSVGMSAMEILVLGDSAATSYGCYAHILVIHVMLTCDCDCVMRIRAVGILVLGVRAAAFYGWDEHVLVILVLPTCE